MAAEVNHTISQRVGDFSGIGGPSLAVEQMGDARSVSDSSPLQIFVRAKKKINDIFVEIEDYVRDTVTYMQSKYKRGTDMNRAGQVGVLVFWYFCFSLLIVH
jgi:mitofusin